MKYYEVTYKNCFGEIKQSLIATTKEFPEYPSETFNLNWNGVRVTRCQETTQYNFSRNIYLGGSK